MFLAWYDDAGSAILNLLRPAFYFICKLVYDIIITLYDSFKIVSGAKVIDISALEQIASRIGLLAGIIMFFLVAFSFVQYILDPDKVSDKEMGGATLVKKIIIVIILLGTSTYIFKTLDTLQDTILNGKIVEKIILPNSVEVDNDNFGKRLSVELFSAFYRYNEKSGSECLTEIEGDGENGSYLSGYVQETGHFPEKLSLGVDNEDCLTGRNNNEPNSNFNGLIALLVGLAAGYFLLMYTIAVGIRVVQLAFLQIMSPAAIIGYLEPKKDNMFSKWLKIYISTYIDVFVRIAIINLCVFLIAVIIEGFSGGSSEFGGTFFLSICKKAGEDISNCERPSMYIMIIMVIAVLSFAKKAPELLKEILPSGNASKIGFGASMKDAVGLTAIAGGAAGAIGGALGGAIGSVAGGDIIGAASGFLKGGLGGIKSRKLGDVIKNSKGGFDSQKSAAFRTRQRMDEGGSRIIPPFNQMTAARFDQEKERLESQNKFANSISSHIDAIKERALGQIDKGKFTNSSHIAKRNAAMQSIEALRERAKNMDIRSFDSWTNSELASRGITSSSANYNEEFNRLRQQEYDRQQENISSEINRYQGIVNTEETEAINDFVMQRQDDAVVAQHISQINSEVQYGPSGVQLGGGTDSWTSLDEMSSNAKQVISDNNRELARNKSEGERARINAKYSGKK